MTTELERRARELLASELRNIGRETMDGIGIAHVADSVLDGTHRFVVIDAALRAIVAALQAQQPGAQAVTDELIDEAVNCAWHVAGTTLHSREDIKAAVKAIYPMFVGTFIRTPSQQPGAQALARTYRLATGEARIDFTEDRFRDLPPGTKLYTRPPAPPPLPEGVSEEDAQTAFRIIIDSARGDPVTLSDVRAALESYRARLAAKGGSA